LKLNPEPNPLNPERIGVQRLDVFVAVMLARERRAPSKAANRGRTPLAVALAALPSRPLEMIAEAVAALGYEEVDGPLRRRRVPSACIVG
jgi:hypothetical protein